MNKEKALGIIWRFCNYQSNITPVEVAIVLGTNDLRHLEKSIELYNQKVVSYFILSGNVGKNTENNATPEWKRMSEIMINNNVPESNLLYEKQATNTGENISFSFKIAKDIGLSTDKVILISKPFMTKRAYAAAKKLFPATEFLPISQDIKLKNYLENPSDTKDEAINAMVGDAERIIKYPEMGYQIEMPYSDEVLEAICVLRKAGYNKYALDYVFCA